jgi:hypothetical protein
MSPTVLPEKIKQCQQGVVEIGEFQVRGNSLTPNPPPDFWLENRRTLLRA